MSNTPRNAPCPCGSGRKYKKCCLAQDNKAAAQRIAEQRDKQARLDQERRELAQRQRQQAVAVLNDSWLDDDDRLLMELTNGVLDLVDDKRFDEALVSCQRLLNEFPEVIDGLDRSAIVHEAQGNHTLAADFYRRCLAFIEQPDQRDGFEQATIDFYRDKIALMEQLAQSP